MEELKQKITAKATKIKRYDNRIKRFQDNRNFQTKEDFSQILKVKRRGQNQRMQEHFGKEYGVQTSNITGMQNELTKQKRRCHLKNRLL